MSTPSLSVVIPTFNRRARLEVVLAKLSEQSVSAEHFDVIVVSDGSTDGTDEYVRALRTPYALTFVSQRNAGVAVARNSGIERATGALLLFLDDDVVPSSELVREHLQSHTEPGLVILGPMLSPANFAMKPWVQWEQAMLTKQYDAIARGQWQPTARQFYTGNTSLERQRVVDAGKFDARFRRAEDVELAYRLATHGARFVFNPKAIGWHYADRSFAGWSEIPYAYGRNDVIMTREGQDWLLPTICHEFHSRHRITRIVTRCCVGRPRLASLATRAMAGIARVAPLSRIAYSGIFNLRHYQGIADELGGRQAFMQALRDGRTRPIPTVVGLVPRAGECRGA